MVKKTRLPWSQSTSSPLTKLREARKASCRHLLANSAIPHYSQGVLMKFFRWLETLFLIAFDDLNARCCLRWGWVLPGVWRS